MNKRTWLALALSTSWIKAWGANLPVRGARRPIVAIIGVAEAKNLPSMNGGVFEALAESSLIRSKVVSVVRRSDLSGQFKEIKFLEPGLPSAADMKAIGNLQVVDYLLSIQPSSAEVEDKSRMVKDIFTGGQKKIESYRVDVTLIFRFTSTNVATSKVLSVITRGKDTQQSRANATDKALQDCYRQLEQALKNGAEDARATMTPVQISVIREDSIRVPLGSEDGMERDAILQVVEAIKDQEYINYKVVCLARAKEVSPKNAILEVGKLVSKNRFQRDDHMLKTLKVPNHLVRFVPTERKGKLPGKDGITRSVDLVSDLK